MKTCKDCGFSYGLAKTAMWNSSGTITERTDANFRLMLIEADTFNGLFRRLEDTLSVPIEHIIFEAQRIATVGSINSVLRGPLRALRWLPGGKRLMVNVFCRLSCWLGESYSKAVVYKPGKLGQAIVRNPFHRELMAAIIVGAFEALERSPFSHTWEMLDDDEVVTVRPMQERPELAERMAFTLPRPKPGKRIWERCPRCGAPSALADLEWRQERGEIVDTRTGFRMVFLPLYVPHVVFRELEAELGEDIYPVILDAQRELSLRNIHEEFIASGRAGKVVTRDKLYQEVLDSLPLRGLGNPVGCETRNGKLTVSVENPFNQHLLAGHLCALYELGEGREATVSWQYADPSTLVVEVTPK